jgi:hypothetical protein
MSDSELIARECRTAVIERREISDACARVIASQWHNGQASLGYSFASTGAITDPSALWRELIPDYDALQRGSDRDAANMLGTYLANAGIRGPVTGWSNLWLSSEEPWPTEAMLDAKQAQLRAEGGAS